jgi:hypothetical protein
MESLHGSAAYVSFSTCFVRKVDETLIKITLNFTKRQKQGSQSSLHLTSSTVVHTNPQSQQTLPVSYPVQKQQKVTVSGFCLSS